jgi:8-oxo-dGTP diphosphatase
LAKLWDAYLADGRKAGRTIARGEPIPKGLYHIVADVLVKHADGDHLVMQRDPHLVVFPGQFEAGASGAVLAGETPYEGALRELLEETGLIADSLTFLFTVNNQRETLFFCYLCSTSCDKQSVTLQEGETIAFRWLSEAEFLAFFQSQEFAAGPRERRTPYLNAVRILGN